MSLDQRNCLDCHGLFSRRFGRIRCNVCQHAYDLEQYRATVGRVKPNDKGIVDGGYEVKAAAEKTQAAITWLERMGSARWDKIRGPNQG